MTEEQIRKNATNYVDSLRDDIDVGNFKHCEMEEAYIKGAHSRDEEVKELAKRIEELEDEVAQLNNGEDY